MLVGLTKVTNINTTKIFPFGSNVLHADFCLTKNF